jgi:hypothetical protein
MQINGSQGLAFPWYILYHLSHTSSPSFFGYFLRAGVSHFFFWPRLAWIQSSSSHPPKYLRLQAVAIGTWFAMTFSYICVVYLDQKHSSTHLLLILFLSSNSPYYFHVFWNSHHMSLKNSSYIELFVHVFIYRYLKYKTVLIIYTLKDINANFIDTCKKLLKDT